MIDGLTIYVTGLNLFEGGVEYKLIYESNFVPVISFFDGREGQTLQEALLKLKELCQKK